MPDPAPDPQNPLGLRCPECDSDDLFVVPDDWGPCGSIVYGSVDCAGCGGDFPYARAAEADDD